MGIDLLCYIVLGRLWRKRIMRQASHKKYCDNPVNKAKVLAYSSAWKRRNPKKNAASRRHYYDKHKDIVYACNRRWVLKNKARVNAYANAAVTGLARRYVVSRITKGTGLRSTDIPEPLIELKRAEIQLRRYLNGDKNHDRNKVAERSVGNAGNGESRSEARAASA